MPRAIRMNDYGDVDVLYVADVPQPEPAADQVVVRVLAAGINPGETGIRTGALAANWPSTFPQGEGSDFAGVVAAVGAEVSGYAPGDEVLGWSDWRSSHADFVAVPVDHLTRKPLALDWIRAGGLFVAGVTAYAAVRAVDLKPGETVVVSGAAGGVGSIAVQLAREKGAHVVGLAGEHNADWLRSVGVTPVTYGEGQAGRLRAAAPDGIDAFVDTYGSGYVDLALELGLPVDRIDTVADFEAVAKLGVKGDGSAAGSDAGILAELAALIAWGTIVLPIAAIYPLGQVRDAYTELAKRHSRGKIVLSTTLADDAGRQAST